ncbi:ABC transporter permease [Paenibacillus lutimineralis]|uniref:ABC transporter permease n=1 Tax=Paenibacillus lutimineralis TaxID=2707005 RepID=A0A3S9UV74_9BACL|nr:ABC transporter permease [Paenibacillus lutimineralis]
MLIIQENEKPFYKEVIKSIIRNKSYLILIFLFIMLTSFMYFFVQFSVDKNLDRLDTITQYGGTLSEEQNALLVALRSNASLASTFLLCLLIISTFVIYLFYKHYFNQHQQEIGIFKALGFKESSIIKAYVTCTFLFSVFASLAGMFLGWASSGVLLKAYTASFGITDVTRGIHVIHIFYGVILVVIVLCVTTTLTCKTFLKKEAALLINKSDNKKENRVIAFVSDKITSILPSKKQFPVRIALRKPITIILSILAVGASTSLLIMSVSLYMSSNKVYQSQSAGHNYSFNIKFGETYQGKSGDYTDTLIYLETPASIYMANSNEPLLHQLVGLSETGDGLLELYDKYSELLSIPENNGILIGPELQEIHGLNQGDIITLSISGGSYSAVIADVAVNAETNHIYMSRKQLAKWMGIAESSYNGLFSNNINSTVTGTVITQEERLSSLEKDAVSNKMSAVINQLLGIVAGCILIYLVLLLNFQDSTKEMLTLDLLGYTPKEINKMLISIYRPIFIVAFLLMIYPSIAICKEIHKSLSLQTGDYIPFQTNAFILLGVFIIIQIIYVLVEAAFTSKIKTMIRNETARQYL